MQKNLEHYKHMNLLSSAWL